MKGPQPRTPESVSWDLLAEELRGLRQAAGEPSYAEIARRIRERRLAQGLSPHRARVARTTVFDAFRSGRTRVNLTLVREIVEALDGDAGQVDAWVTRCREALQAAPAGPAGPAVRTETPTPLPEEPATLDAPAAPTARTAPTAGTARSLALLAACVAVNLLGRVFVDFFHLPIYLDMVGTAAAAIALGPWRGAAVGGATNLLGVLTSGPASLPFAAVNIAGALVWGYGVRRFGFGRSLARFFSLNLIVALVSTVVAVPILVLLYDGSTGHAQDTIRDTFLALTHAMIVAIGVSNTLVSVGDKLISGFLALVAVSMLPADLRPGLRLTLVSARPEPDPAQRSTAPDSSAAGEGPAEEGLDQAP